MRRFLVAVALASVLVGSTAVAAPTFEKAGTVRCAYVRADTFKPFSAAVWRLPAWSRGKPSKRIILKQRSLLACAAGPGHRKAMQRTWREDKRAYYAERKSQLERLRYLPEDCGGGVRSAIPCSIMWCESEGSYTADNPTSTAYGKYQMLDTTYAAYCHSCDWSPPDQDRAAYELYRASGGSPWVCS